MRRLVISRLIQLPAILAVIFVVTFFLAWVVPGNPLEDPDGRRPPAEVQEAMLRQYNLHSPWAFAGSYVKGIFLGKDNHPPPYFGPSLKQRNRTVNDILLSGLPFSVALGLVAIVMALLIGLVAGVVGALWPRTVFDQAGLGLAIIGISLPTFVTASIFMAFTAVFLNWVPAGGWNWPGWDLTDAQWWQRLAAVIQRIWLPALALSLAPAAYIARLIRLGLADLLESDFVRTARAKGLSEMQVVMDHALKPAFLPVLSFLGPATAATLTGSFVVEQVFEIPGIGRDFVNAVLDKDQTLILGIVLTYSTMLVMFNLIVDVAYAWFDPRINLSGE